MKKTLLSAALTAVLLLGLVSVPLAAEAQPLSPSGLLATADGGLLIADSYEKALWQRSADGSLTRLAGRAGVRDLGGIPLGGYQDGKAAEAAFASPWGVAPYLSGWVVSDTDNHVLRYVEQGQVRTLAGSGKEGSANGLGLKAAFSSPTGLAADEAGNLYVADTGNSLIRKIDQTGQVTSFVTAGLLEPTALAWADGALYVADSGNNRICRVEKGVLTPLTGGEDGFRDGPAAQALFSHPQGLAVSGGSVYIADTGNGAVRVLKNGVVSTLVSSAQLGGGLYPVSPRGLALVGQALFVGDVFARTLFSVNVAAPPFADVPETAWYTSALSAVYGRGLMNGVSQGRFAPAGTLSRSMCATILYRLAAPKQPGASPALPDAPGHTAAQWAVSNQVLSAENGSFLPQRPATRAELVSGLYRCAQLAGLSVTAQAELSAFSDGKTIPQGSEAALRWALSAGVLTGTADGRLAPDAPVTRAQAAVFLQRYLLWAE